MQKFQSLLESFGMLTREQRMFYPRNFNLSPEFVKALKKEIATLDRAGLPAEKFVVKLNKALQFYVSEYNKTKKLADPASKSPGEAEIVKKSIDTPTKTTPKFHSNYKDD